MSLSHHPSIPRNGLVFYSDPANFKSYPAGQDSYVNNVSLILDFNQNFANRIATRVGKISYRGSWGALLHIL